MGLDHRVGESLEIALPIQDCTNGFHGSRRGTSKTDHLPFSSRSMMNSLLQDRSWAVKNCFALIAPGAGWFPTHDARCHPCAVDNYLLLLLLVGVVVVDIEDTGAGRTVVVAAVDDDIEDTVVVVVAAVVDAVVVVVSRNVVQSDSRASHNFHSHANHPRSVMAVDACFLRIPKRYSQLGRLD